MLLLLLFGVSALIDFFARIRMEMAQRHFALMDDRTINEMRVIDFVHSHVWIVMSYVALFFVGLMWMEFRRTPRRAIWIAFVVLAVPSLVYGRACFHIGGKFIFFVPLEHQAAVQTALTAIR